MKIKLAPIKDCPKYFITKQGNVYSNHYGELRLRKAKTTKKGYREINLIHKSGKQKFIRVHKIVLETFIGRCPKGWEARHLNGNRSDNRLSNLRWGTRKQNANDKRRHGTMPWGERSKLSKLNELQVRIIRRCTDIDLICLSKYFNVSFHAIYLIQSEQRNWANLKEKNPHAKYLSILSKRGGTGLNFVQYRIARRCRKVGKYFLSTIFKTSPHIFYRVANGTYKWADSSSSKITLHRVAKQYGII